MRGEVVNRGGRKGECLAVPYMSLSGIEDGIYALTSFEAAALGIRVCVSRGDTIVSTGIVKCGDTTKTGGIEQHGLTLEEKITVVPGGPGSLCQGLNGRGHL